MTRNPFQMKYSFPILGLLFLLAVQSCSFQTTGENSESRIGRDSIVVDLFSLNCALRIRGLDGELTPRGQTLLQNLDSSIWVGEELVFVTTKNVRSYFAYMLHTRDLYCAKELNAENSLLTLTDDSIPGHCIDTAYAYVPAYPYWKPFEATYLAGKGFWVLPSEVDFALGQLKIVYEYIP
jgi:hypothetical protein